ncbi:MAG: O-antigen ligase family protein [Aliarcobacter sp.]|nr:O-antigen ligase family protein [Aliarcobacter sp.]
MQKPIFQSTFFFILILFVLFSMSLSIVSINAGINIRIGQLAILLMFGFVLLDDLKNKSINETLLVFFIFFAILLTFVSKSSSYSKIDEMKFVIKYMLIFPATFYIGQWSVRNFKIEDFFKVIEISLASYILMAFILSVYPIGFLYNDRGELSGFQGTFLETGWFALVVGAFTISSILGRLDFNLKFSKVQYILYFFSMIALVLSKNKTIWMGIFLIITFIILFKSIIASKENVKESVKKLKAINSFYFIFAFIVFVTLFFAVNSILAEPIVSVAMLEEKLNDERGKAYLVAIRLIENSDWFGGYGFGFIQQYFSVYTDEIIGLDENSGMIFNSYLDVWISVGILGVLFHFLLLKFAFSRTHLLTMILPIYWFIAANTNPTIGDEYYYLFLGISYGLIIKYKKEGSV